MTYLTFNPPVGATLETTIDTTPRVIKAQFSDGYSLAARDGLNSVLPTLQVGFQGSPVEIDAIVAFFADRGGADPFYWTAPWEASARLYRASTWSRSFVAGNIHKISVKLEQVPG